MSAPLLYPYRKDRGTMWQLAGVGAVALVVALVCGALALFSK